MSYKEDIKIDKDRLEHELMRQASLYLQYSEDHAHKIRFRDKCKNHLKVVWAELNLQIHKNWRKEFDAKPNAQAVEAWIVSHKKHKKATMELIKAEEQVNLSDAIKWAFAQRKSALEGLVTLIVTGYYSEPNPKGNKKSNARREKLGKKSLKQGK